MATTAIGAGTLRRLSQLHTDGHPVLSLYVDLDPSRFPTPAARGAELSALLSHAGAGSLDADRVREVLGGDSDLMRGAGSLAVFSSVEAGVLKVVPLPGHVEPMAVVDTVPWLEPLAAMVTSENWGVAVVSRSAARLFRGGPRALVEFATIDDELHRRHAQGGWSQARFQRGIEEQVAEHVRRTAELLRRAHQRHRFDHLVIVASGELAPVMEANLHRDLRDRLAGLVALDLEHAPAQDIVRAVAPVVDRADKDRERALIVRLEEALGIGGPAAAGLDEVLSTLEQDRVQTLLVAHGASLHAQLCPLCGQLSANGERRCRLDGAPLGSVDAIEHALELAAHQSAQVAVMRHEVAALRNRGSIAALLRW